MNWYTFLNNREWAILVWLLILIIVASFNKGIRTSFGALIKAFLATPIIVSLVLMTTYILLIVWSLSAVGFWDYSELKSTIIWGITVGFVALFRISSIQTNEHYFHDAVIDNLKASVLVEYLVNFYVFSLPIELVFVPLTVFIGSMLGIAKSDQKYKPVERMFTFVTSLLGIGILCFVIYSAYNDFNNLVSIATLKDFLLPIILSVMFLPFLYASLLYSTYEQFYVRLSFFIKEPKLLKYTKLQSMLFCNFNLKMLNRFSQRVILQRPKNKQEVLDLLKNSKFN